MSASTPQTIRKIPRTHLAASNQNSTRMPAIMANIAITVLLIVMLLLAIELNLLGFDFTSHIIDFWICCQYGASMQNKRKYLVRE
jgi:hypothetical protein